MDGTELSGDRLDIWKLLFAAVKGCSLWSIGSYEKESNAFLNRTLENCIQNRYWEKISCGKSASPVSLVWTSYSVLVPRTILYY
jgi:hypothetical protein